MSLKLNMLDNYTGVDQKKYLDLKNNPKLYNVSDLALRVMFNRGLKDIDSINNFLFDNVKNLYDPFLLPDADKFCDVVLEAIKKGEKIINYTDYDADGIGSGVTCVDGINILINKMGSSSTINWYANNRFQEGYGITVGGIDDLLSKHPDTKLIITTDNGIVAFDAIEKCNKLGIKVVITDHHRVLIDEDTGEQVLPNALAVVDPHRTDSIYPYKEICGAGVIFKLLLALAKRIGEPEEIMYPLLDVVAMATVGDMMPLLIENNSSESLHYENRIFIKEGLKRIANEDRLAFQALREGLERQAKIKGNERVVKVDEDLLGFTYCPMLNALGRLGGSIDKAMELFFSDNKTHMDSLVDEIILNNEDRKKYTEEQTALAISIVDSLPEIPDVICLYHDDFMEGIVGLIAGRIREKYNRPTIIFAKNGDNLKGSARSIDDVNMIESLLKLGDLLLKCGGHPGAAGLSISFDDFKKFNKEINFIIKLTDDQKIKKLNIDTAFATNEISEELIYSLEVLAPFGMNFEKPRFGLKNFVADIPATGNPYRGANGETVRLVNSEGFTVIMFKNPDAFKKIEYKLGRKEIIKCIGYPAVNVFNNKTSLQMKVEEGYMF